MKYLFSYICLFFTLNFANAQSLDSSRIENLRLLTSTVFKQNIAIDNLFRCTSFEKNDSLSEADRLKLFQDYIDKTRKNKSNFYKASRLNYLPYSSLTNKKFKIPFATEIQKDTYVVMSNNKPLFYVLFEKDKDQIVSFDYLQKGENGPAYFVTY